METVKTQFGIAASADFDTMTWAFEMPENFSVWPGEFAIVDKQVYDELLKALLEAKEVLLQLDHRHNGKCYNPGSEKCNCTLCRIETIIKKA
jgi:hypothetical protein